MRGKVHNFKKIVLIISLFVLNAMNAQTNTWDGSTNNNWNTAANWSLNLVPTNAHDVIININANISVNGSSHTVNSLTITGSSTVVFTSAGAGRVITIDNTGSSIGAGSSLTLNGSTGTGVRSMTIDFTGTNRSMAIAGTLNVTDTGDGSEYDATNSVTTVTGTFINSGGATTSTAANLSFSAGGNYQHDINGSTIPTATWNASSNCNIIGIGGTAPGGLGQTFGNFTWNCTGQSGAINNVVSLGLNNIVGNFTISSTNGQTLNFNTSGTNRTLAVGGNFSLSGGDVDFASGNGNTSVTVGGNVSVTGTALLTTTTTNPTTLNGTFVMNGAGNRTLNFTTPANIAYTNVTVSSGTTLELLSGVLLSKDATNAAWRGTITVNSGGILNIGTQVVDGTFTGNAVFNLNSGGKVITANATGLQGSVITANVTPTYNSGASYEFRGAATGVFTLTTANTITGILTFNRAAGVTINQNFIATTLALTSGAVTTGGNSITIASGGTYTGGSVNDYVNGTLRRVYPSAASLVFPVGKSGVYRPVTFQYTALTGTSTVTVEQFETALTGTLPAGVNLNNARTWDISQTGGSAFTYKVTLDPTGDTPTGTVVMLKKESGTITSNAATSPNYTNTTGFTTLTGTNNFTLGSDCAVTATAGADQATCLGSSVTLAANTPVVGSGAWTVSGPSILTSQFSSTTNPAAIFTAAGGAGVYTLTWTVTNGACSAADTVSINVGDSTTWNGTSWSNGTPDATKAAIFTGNFTIGADMEACSLTVSSSAVVSVTSGFNVTLNGAITVSSGSFTLGNNANLIQLTDVANSGNIIVKRNTKALKRLDYTLWSSPVAAQNLQSFSPGTLATRFYTYTTSSNLYSEVASPSTTSFSVGTGYLIRLPNAFPTTPTVWPGSFTGVPNNGTYTVGLTNVAAGQRFNAIGNPYPSAIDLDEFVADNSSQITGTIYLWRKTNSTLTSPGYCTWTAGTYVTNGEAQTVPNDASFVDILSTGQGFIVEATASGSSVEFNNSQRITDNSNQFFRTENIERNRMWLNLTKTGGGFYQTAVGYITGATQGVDSFDGKYFNDGTMTLNSIINNQDYVIQGRSLPFDDTDVVPLSLTVAAAGEYTISIDHLDGFFSGDQRIFLKDNTNNSLYDLKEASYTFTTEAGTFTTRFSIVYRNPRESNVLAATCGQTLSALDENIYSNLVAGAQGYRFRVTNVATNQVQSIDRALRVFKLTQLANYAFAQNYQVEVAVKYNNVWQPFGNACTVTTPTPLTKVETQLCGSTLTGLSQVILANQVSFAQGYRFRITNMTTSASVEIDRPLRDIRLSSVAGVETNTAYQFEVAVKNTDGTYLPYGEACIINSPINDTAKANDGSFQVEWKAVAYPNPFANDFTLSVTSSQTEQVQVSVYDMLGKLMMATTLEVDVQSELQLGSELASGVYHVIVSQGENVRSLRVIKR